MFKTVAKIADLVIEFNTIISDLKKVCEKYLSDDNEPDIVVYVSPEEIEKEKSFVLEGEEVSIERCESLCAYRGLCKQLWKFDALVLHCATFAVDGQAVAFAAKSGTGKTTHMRLWKKYLGDRMVAINGDKPIIRFNGVVPFAYGTPWRGKEGFGKNMSAPLTNICFIERSETNFVEKISKNEALDRIFNQILLPNDPLGSIKTLQMVDRLLEVCDLWVINCNMDSDAPIVAYNSIIGDGKDKL